MRLPAIAAILLFGGTASAFVGSHAPRDGSIVAAGRQPRLGRTLIPARNPPAGWQATQDRDTGVISALWGGHVDAPGAVADPAIAERAARAFLAAHLAVLAPGSTIADLSVVANQLDRGVRTIGFAQTWRGLRVVGGQLYVVIGHDRVFAAGSTAFPNVHAVIPPARGAPTARAEAWVTAQTTLPVTTRASGERVVLPIVHGPGDLAYQIADRLDVESTGAPGRWDVYVAADGAPLLRASTLMFATGTLTYDVGDRYPAGTRHDVPVPAAAITADGVATVTAVDGSFTWAGAAPASVVPGLVGSVVRIANGAGPLATASLTAQPGAAVRWSLAGQEFGDAQLATFIYGSIAKARARLLEPALASWLDLPLDFHVNDPDICNAFSTGNDVHFFRSGPGCENTGRVADVVFHEFGHSLHNHSIIAGAGAFEQQLSEGLADYSAARITEDHGIGRGFFLDDSAVRDLDPFGTERVWPVDRHPDPHVTGMIVGGALWDLRTALISELGHDAGVAATDRVFVGILQRAADIPGSYLAALIADDDDGDLGNGTPHRCAIDTAFGRHGLAEPTFETTTVGPPIASGLTISVPVTVPATACPPPHVTAVTLSWHVGTAAPTTIDLSLTGTTWAVTLPPQPDDTLVRYSLTATLDDGSARVFPDNPADPEYQLYVGPTTPIYCEAFDAPPPWTQTGNPLWQWGTPVGNPLSRDPITGHTSAHVFGVDVLDDGLYEPADVTAATTPVIDATGFREVRLQYWRWLTIEDATYDQAQILVDGTEVWANAKSARGTLDHVDQEWRFHDVDVTPHATAPFTLTWSQQSDATYQLGGWTLDHVCVVGVGRLPRCGDGTLDDGEACDDGNTTSGDGCSATCTVEGDDAGCCSSGARPAGPIVLGLLVLGLVRRRRQHATS